MIPKDWRKESIKHFAKIGTGGKDTQDKVDGGKYPFYVRSATIERINSYSFDGVAVLTVGDGVGTGKVFHFINGKCEIHQRVYKICEFRDHIEPKYFFYYFSEYFNQRVQTLSAKNSVDSVRMEMISEMEVNVPSLGEQKKIAEILTSVDRVIELTSMELEKLKDLKKGMMQALIINPIEKWRKVELESCLIKSPKNGYSPVEVDYNTGKFVLSLGCVTVNGFEPKNFKKVDIEKDKLDSFVLNDGDFLITRSNTREFVGLCGIYKKTRENVIYPDLMVRLEFNPEIVDKYFMLKVFQTSWMRQIVASSAQGTSESMVKINSEIIKKIKLPLPKIDEQRKISNAFKCVDERLEWKSKKLSSLINLKKGLMSDLLTGKVRVKV